MAQSFYNSKEYKELQSQKMKENWKKGLFDCLYNQEERICDRKGCEEVFKVQKSDPKVYCSSSCAAKVNNVKRGPRPESVKLKISKALEGRPNPHKGHGLAGGPKVPRIETTCTNPECQKIFLRERWRQRKFCSNKCAMAVIGGKPTSPRASRGKAGIRKDINNHTYFYSRWEANVARLFNYLNIEWAHEPKTFNLKTQTYTPDFYLPEYDFYVEVKNFMWKYSEIRDKKFRELYPDTILVLLMKVEYLELQDEFSHLIKNWEYRNSPFKFEKV